LADSKARRQETGNRRQEKVNSDKTIFLPRRTRRKTEQQKIFLPTKKCSKQAKKGKNGDGRQKKGKSKQRKSNFYREGHEEREEITTTAKPCLVLKSFRCSVFSLSPVSLPLHSPIESENGI